MAIRQIRMVEDEILRKKCRPVEEVNEPIRRLLNDMADTMYDTKNGAGLAAPQVGILKRLVVIDMGQGLIKLVNPVIVKQEGIQEVIEGCLSIPGVTGRLQRPAKITVEALNENGENIRLEGTGELAKCFCHELDHLDGVLFTDKVTEYIHFN